MSTYESLRKKFKELPSFNLINKEFEIGVLEKRRPVLKQIVKKILEKIQLAIDFLESIVLPDSTSVIEIYESEYFNQKEKEDIFKLLQQLIILQKELQIAELALDESIEAKAIAKVSKAYPEIRKAILNYLEKAKACWEKGVEIKEIQKYFA